MYPVYLILSEVFMAYWCHFHPVQVLSLLHIFIFILFLDSRSESYLSHIILPVFFFQPVWFNLKKNYSVLHLGFIMVELKMWTHPQACLLILVLFVESSWPTHFSHHFGLCLFLLCCCWLFLRHLFHSTSSLINAVVY